MSVRGQASLLVILIVISIGISNSSEKSIDVPAGAKRESRTYEGSIAPAVMYERAAFLKQAVQVDRAPARRWDILDPAINGKAVLIQSLNEYFPFLKINSTEVWPIASLTKVITAIVVKEQIGLNKKISVSETAVKTVSDAGALKVGEIYSSQDLLKLMLVSSSNDAAVAFEEYFNGRENLVKLMTEKIKFLGMRNTILDDASGLSDLNRSSAEDLLLLIQYLILEEPEIFSWMRLQNVLIQPLNDIEAKNIHSTNSFIDQSQFLGGKTGTSGSAKENFMGVFVINGKRVALVLLGSDKRAQEVVKLLEWVEEAYQF